MRHWTTYRTNRNFEASKQSFDLTWRGPADGSEKRKHLGTIHLNRSQHHSPARSYAEARNLAPFDVRQHDVVR